MEQVSISQRLAAVAWSVDGLGVGLYSLVAAVLPEASSGAVAWRDTVNRNERLSETDRNVVPITYTGKVEGNRQQTHVVPFEHAPSVVRFVLKDPMDFFGDNEAHEALIQLAGHVATETVTAELNAAEEQRAETRACLLPALIDQGSVSMQLRTSVLDGQLLGSVHDFIAWLGLDRNHAWYDWLEEAFKIQMSLRSESDFSGPPSQSQCVVLKHIVLPRDRCQTPMTNYAGFCLILRLCAGRSAISDAMIDEATATLGRVKVGDSRLHVEIDQNAAAASAEDRAFVLGSAAEEEQATTSLSQIGTNTSAVLLEAARQPDIQLLMNTYWRDTIALQTEVVKQRAESEITGIQVESHARIAEAKEREAKAGHNMKTNICDETGKRQALTALHRAEVAGHRSVEMEANCRIAESKRRLAEIDPSFSSRGGGEPSSRRPRRNIGTTTTTTTLQTGAEQQSLQPPQSAAPLARPLRGAALVALRALPPDPEYNAYRAAGIPDHAIPRDETQSQEWYGLAHRQQLLLRPTRDVESRASLLPRGSLDIYGQPVRPEFCCPALRTPP